MDEPQIIHASSGEELVVLTRAVYDALVAAAAAANDEVEDFAEREIAQAAKADWETAGRPAIPLTVLRRVRAGDSYLKAFRAERGLTQSELALQAGITQGYLSECETARKAPNAATRDVLAKALDIHPIWLSEDAPRGALGGSRNGRDRQAGRLSPLTSK